MEARDPYPGETIAHYLGVDVLNLTDNAQFSAQRPPVVDDLNNAKSLSKENDSARINGRDMSSVEAVPWKPSPITGRPLVSRPIQVPISATYNVTANKGYNITIPGCTPADTVLGDWVGPSGAMVEDCTLAQMSQKLSLPAASLFDFTKCRNPFGQNQLNYGSRWFRFDLEKFSNGRFAYYSTLLAIPAGVLSVSYPGIRMAIKHEGITANITLDTQSLILAIFGAVATTCVVLWERETRRIGRAEAIALNAFLFLGEKFYDTFASGLQCVQEVPLKEQITTVVEKLSQGARILVHEDAQAHAMRTAGSSSVNLVAQGADIENQLANVRCGH